VILFDITVPQRVLFFKNIIKKLNNVIVTTRGGEGYKEVLELLNLHKIPYILIGKYGGNSLEGKLKTSIKRQDELIEIIKKYNIKTVVSGSVVDASRVGFGLGLKVVNINDMPVKSYRFKCENIEPVTRLTAPLSSVLFKPFVVPDEIFEKLGVCNIKTYNFLDPLIWLKDFKVNKNYVKSEIPQIDESKPIVVVREEEFKASYVKKKYPFLYEVIEELQNWDINLVIVPRYESKYLKEKFKRAIVLDKAIILQHLLAKTSLFIGGGGTINIEATYFGVPVISTRSFISHYDKFLIDNGLMWHSNNKEEILDLAKKLIGVNNKAKAKEVYSKMDVNIDMFVREIVDDERY